MDEHAVAQFWEAHPCGDLQVGGLSGTFAGDYEQFFDAYDVWRYRKEAHILACLDELDLDGRVLEIGLGQGADSEQLIRRGARWSGLDVTKESIDRVATRLRLRDLDFEDLRQGTVTDIPWPDGSFDVVFSHGVLHHVPNIHAAQREIHRVLRPGGRLIAMLYARKSLNYQVSIRLVRRAALAAIYPVARARLVRPTGMLAGHVENARRLGLRRYLRMDEFLHHNTDGPQNPHSRVYSRAQVGRDFPDFTLIRSHQHFMHAPPLPASRLPLERWLGWHLWVELAPR